MATPADGVCVGDWEVSTPLELVSERPDVPEWHSLRLFGRGRRPGTFADGAEAAE